METPDFTLKRSDVGKTISGQFLDGDDLPVDCTGNTARVFWVRDYFTNEVVIAGVTFTIWDELTGKFRYAFTAPDLAAMTPDPRDDAWFKAEFKVSLFGGTVMTSPTNKDRPYLIIKFEDDLSS